MKIKFECRLSFIQSLDEKRQIIELKKLCKEVKNIPNRVFYHKVCYLLSEKYYQNLKYEKAKKIIQPIIDNYQCFKYTPEFLNMFLLLGNIELKNGNYSLSQYYFKKAIKLAKRKNDKNALCLSYLFLSNADIQYQNYKSAINNLNKSIIYIDYALQMFKAEIYVNFARCYKNIGDVAKALSYFNIAINDYNALDYDNKMIVRSCGLDLYLKLKDIDKYKEYKKMILDECQNNSKHEYLEAYKILSKNALLDKDYELFFKMIELLQEYGKDDIASCIFTEHLKGEYYRQKNNLECEIKSLRKEIKLLNKRNLLQSERLSKNIDVQMSMSYLKKVNEETLKTNNKLKMISTTDSLTKVKNRLALDTYIKKLNNLHVSDELYIIMMDIDDFKHINDDNSHIVGDNVLRCVGKIMNKLESDNFSSYRYGGDEFAIIAKNINDQQIHEKIIDLLNKIEKIKVNGFQSEQTKITATFGISKCCYPFNIMNCINKADKMLYIGKKEKKHIVFDY